VHIIGIFRVEIDPCDTLETVVAEHVVLGDRDVKSGRVYAVVGFAQNRISRCIFEGFLVPVAAAGVVALEHALYGAVGIGVLFDA